jgi:outer membrane lipopolysaccharide assembly protein LptE/RlpB
MAILEEHKQQIRQIREQGRRAENQLKAFEIYNVYNPNNKVRKTWCGGCSERVYRWIESVEL